MSDGVTNRSTIGAYVARIEARDWDGADLLIHPDVVYELPQTRERTTGREGLRAFNTAYPATGTSGSRRPTPTTGPAWRGSTGR